MSDPRGSVWRKWDLHIHTRNDQNYTCLGPDSLSSEQLDRIIQDTGLTKAQITSQERQIDPDQYAKLFVSCVGLFTDLSVVAITNHNDATGIDEIMREAETNRLITILPGLEVTSSHGLHILCIFDPNKKWRNTWVESLDHFLTEIGVPPERIDQQRGPLNSSRMSQYILESTAIKNGICIFAHIGTDNGLFRHSNVASGGAAHIDIYTHNLCNIVQIPSNSSIDRLSDILNGRDTNYGNKKVTQIKCSDARKLTDIGNTFTWIKADPTFEGLKQIVYEPKARVRIQEENPSESETYAKIGKCHIELPADLMISDELGEKTDFCIRGEYDLHFSNNLTSIIGGRGSGKSTIIHLIYNSQTQEAETLKKINSPLLNLDLPHSPVRAVADGTDCEVPAQTEFFFQNDIEQAAKSIEQMSDLIRRRLDKLSSIEGESLEGKQASWQEERAQLDNLIDAYDQISRIENQIALANSNIKILEKQTQVITSEEYKKHQAAVEKHMLAISGFNSYQEEYTQLIKQTTALKTTIDKLRWDDDQGKDILTEFRANIETYESKLATTFNACKEVYDAQDFTTLLAKKKEQLKTYLRNKGLAPENVQELANANQDISELRQNIERLNSEKQPHSEVYQRRTQIIENYRLAFTAYKNRLNDAASSLESTLAGLQSTQKEIRFSIHSDETELRKKTCDFVKGTLKDETTLRSDVIDRVLFSGVDTEEYADDSEKIRQHVNDATGAEKHTEVLRELINDDVFLEQLRFRIAIHRFDISNLLVQTKLGGTLLQNTSFGERCGISIAIILAAGTNPIIIDQPEDHLDGKFISTILVPLIRKQKHNRQIVLITRDANIVVGGDAELIHILETANARTEICPSTVEDIQNREKYIWILDGGREAFRTREHKYDIESVETAES